MVVKAKNIVIVDQVEKADTFWKRCMGLMFKNEITQEQGLLLCPCNSIHTFFMRFNIDIIFLDSTDRIIKIIRSMPPWRLTWIYFKSKKVLELKGGSFPLNLNEGDVLEITDV